MEQLCTYSDLRYVNLILSIRDRNELINVLCRHHPDLLTPIARDLVTAYEPIIRAIHNAVDLSGTVYDTQVFLDDLIQLSKPKSDNSNTPSVEDYIKLLEAHQSSCHRFLHQAIKNGPEIRKKYNAFGQKVLAEFRTNNSKEAISTFMIEQLNTIFVSLSPTDQDAVRQELHAQQTHLTALSESSHHRIKALLEHRERTAFGPGIHLARWQNLLDDTALSPSQANGPVRYGKDAAGDDRRNGVLGEKLEADVQNQLGRSPDVKKTVSLLGGKFWEMLREWDLDKDEEVADG